ncbi:hypothetical protein [Moraxella lacunata]|uniref:hypothetical protein n=1 Tax=Moraxella lacunata TaxID=477 RepID=UPI003EE3E3E4
MIRHRNDTYQTCNNSLAKCWLFIKIPNNGTPSPRHPLLYFIPYTIIIINNRHQISRNL